MTADSTHPHRTARFAPAALVTLLAAAALLATAGSAAQIAADAVGRDATVARASRPGIEAAFPQESYTAGDRARLVLYSAVRGLRLQVFRAGTEAGSTHRRDEMLGTPVAPVVGVGDRQAGQSVRVRVGDWPTGLYFVRLETSRRLVGYAPFVVRPRRLGEHRVAVVLPTFTWQAYNFRDDDRDGDADTWYAGKDERFARLGRPYENRGVPTKYNSYEGPFLRWLSRTGREVDILAQTDMARLTGARLAAAYDLVVFPGHHEYVTTAEYDAVTNYRDRGGHIMFLAANNFFARVDIRGNAIWRIGRWRDLGRPEAALVGVQYIGWDPGVRRGPWRVRNVSAAPWLFRETGLRSGSALSSGGIEIDHVHPSSPRGVRVLAEIPDVFGPGMTAQMTYYETRRGAKVFAAGAFSLAAAIWQPPVRALVGNLWARLGPPPERSRVARWHGR